MALRYSDIAEYTPYGLQLKDNETEEIGIVTNINLTTDMVEIDRLQVKHISQFKPILRNIKDLASIVSLEPWKSTTFDIMRLKEGIIPINYLMDIATGMGWSKTHYLDMPLIVETEGRVQIKTRFKNPDDRRSFIFDTLHGFSYKPSFNEDVSVYNQARLYKFLHEFHFDYKLLSHE